MGSVSGQTTLKLGIVCAVLALSACGSHPAAKTAAKSPCSAGKTLIEGHFHYQACVASTEARVAKICAEAAYELEGIVSRASRSPEPGAFRSELGRERRETEVMLSRAIAAAKATGEPASLDIKALSQHREKILALAREAQRSTEPPYNDLFKPFEFHVCRTEHVAAKRST